MQSILSLCFLWVVLGIARRCQGREARLRGYGHVRRRGDYQRLGQPVLNPYCVKMYRPRRVGRRNGNSRELIFQGGNVSRRRPGRWDEIRNVNRGQYQSRYDRSRARRNGNSSSKPKRRRRKRGRKGSEEKVEGPLFVLPQANSNAEAYQIEWYYDDPKCYDT